MESQATADYVDQPEIKVCTDVELVAETANAVSSISDLANISN